MGGRRVGQGVGRRPWVGRRFDALGGSVKVCMAGLVVAWEGLSRYTDLYAL